MTGREVLAPELYRIDAYVDKSPEVRFLLERTPHTETENNRGSEEAFDSWTCEPTRSEVHTHTRMHALAYIHTHAHQHNTRYTRPFHSVSDVTLSV